MKINKHESRRAVKSSARFGLLEDCEKEVEGESAIKRQDPPLEEENGIGCLFFFSFVLSEGKTERGAGKQNKE